VKTVDIASSEIIREKRGSAKKPDKRKKDTPVKNKRAGRRNVKKDSYIRRGLRLRGTQRFGGKRVWLEECFA